MNETRSLPYHLPISPETPKPPITSPRDKLLGTFKGNFNLQKKTTREQPKSGEEPKVNTTTTTTTYSTNSTNSANSTSSNNGNQRGNKYKTQVGTVDLNDLDEFIAEYSKQSNIINNTNDPDYPWRYDLLRKDSGNLDIHLWNLINGNSKSYRTKKITDDESDASSSSSRGPSAGPSPTFLSPNPSPGPSPQGTPSASPSTSSNNLLGSKIITNTTSTATSSNLKSSTGSLDKLHNSTNLGSSMSLIASPKIAASHPEKGEKPSKPSKPMKTSGCFPIGLADTSNGSYAPRRNTIGDASFDESALTRKRSQSMFASTEDVFVAPGNPEQLNKIVEQQYDEMNTRLTYLREQIGNLAAKHYGPNTQRKLQSKQSMKRRKPQHFNSLEHVHVESSWKKHTKSFSQLSCVCLVFNQIGQVVYCQNSVSKVQQHLGNSKLLKSRSLMRIAHAIRPQEGGIAKKANEPGFLESGIRFHTTPTQAIASMQGSLTMDLTIPNIPENGTSVLVLITPEDSDNFSNFSHVSTKVSTIGKPKSDGKTYTEKNWGVWNKLIPEPASSSCESLAVMLLSREDPSVKNSKWRLDFLCSEISELNTEELPIDFLQNSMVVKNYLPTKFQLEKCMEEFSALEQMDNNWDFLSMENDGEEEDTSKEIDDADEFEPAFEPNKDRELIEAKLDEILKEYNIPSAPRWAGGNIFRIGNTPLPIFLIGGSLYVHVEDQQIKFEEWLSKFVKKIVRIEIVRSGTFGV